MIVPEKHVAKIYELQKDDYVFVSLLARRLAVLLEEAVECKSVAYLAFGSGLPHAHLHLVPHDNPAVVVEPLKHVRSLSDEELKQNADQLRSLLPTSWWRI